MVESFLLATLQPARLRKIGDANPPFYDEGKESGGWMEVPGGGALLTKERQNDDGLRVGETTAGSGVRKHFPCDGFLLLRE